MALPLALPMAMPLALPLALPMAMPLAIYTDPIDPILDLTHTSHLGVLSGSALGSSTTALYAFLRHLFS
jgi:hypothetical protein